MIIGVGVDIAEIARFEGVSVHFLERCFSKGERQRIASRGESTAAGIFAAHEAALKALGTGFSDAGLNDIEITWHDSGSPQCTVTGASREHMNRLRGERMHISISHSGGMAVAFAILEGVDPS